MIATRTGGPIPQIPNLVITSAIGRPPSPLGIGTVFPWARRCVVFQSSSARTLSAWTRSRKSKMVRSLQHPSSTAASRSPFSIVTDTVPSSFKCIQSCNRHLSVVGEGLISKFTQHQKSTLKLFLHLHFVTSDCLRQQEPPNFGGA